MIRSEENCSVVAARCGLVCCITIVVFGCTKEPSSSAGPTVQLTDQAHISALPEPSEGRADDTEAAAAPLNTPMTTPGEGPQVAPTASRSHSAPKGLDSDEAANPLPISIYLADQYRYVGQKQQFRVTAESGEYFNCYYKQRRASYHHVRLRGDSSAYLDGYLPRDAAGERLFTELQKKDRKLTVTVMSRENTMSSVCMGQVEILDFKRGFDFDTLPAGEAGAKARRIMHQKNREHARNRPRISHYIEQRKSYIEKPRTFRVRARLDRYFQCKYAGEERRYYAVFLQGDDYKGLRAYLPRNIQSEQLVRWLAVNEGAPITATVVVKQERYDQVCNDQVEVLSWKKGWKD